MDASTFKNVFIPISRKLYVVAFRLLENREDAQDAVQETLAKLWAKRENLYQIANNEKFAVTVLRNVCLDFMKAKKMKFTDFDENLINDTPLPDTMEARENVVIIRRLIDDLPAMQRKVMKLKHWDNFSDAEIAQATGINAGNIRVLLSRARRTVKERFLKIENKYH
ncbi:MAG: RNA polymerase sigma factor [Prevotellaceae bacterium]|jgi:RNA polymerase sigma-70 factor (ECF subfamily)|nr:RNA polymerase sigma factor [Prevotellaceae bacterium]